MPTPLFIQRLRAKVGNELLQVPTVAVLAYNPLRELLLVQDKDDGLWSCPGGIVEPHELPSDAAIRETWEETRVLVELSRLAGVFAGEHCSHTYKNGDQIAWVSTLFIAEAPDGQPYPDNEETQAARFFPIEKITTLMCKPHLSLFLRSAAAKSGAAYFKSPTWRPSEA